MKYVELIFWLFCHKPGLRTLKYPATHGVPLIAFYPIIYMHFSQALYEIVHITCIT